MGSVRQLAFQFRQLAVTVTRLLAEVSEHEQQRNLELTLQAFRDYQQGIHPSGPGARELLDFFASVDYRLTGPASGSPAVAGSDREVLNLLSKRAPHPASRGG